MEECNIRKASVEEALILKCEVGEEIVACPYCGSSSYKIDDEISDDHSCRCNECKKLFCCP